MFPNGCILCIKDLTNVKLSQTIFTLSLVLVCCVVVTNYHSFDGLQQCRFVIRCEWVVNEWMSDGTGRRPPGRCRSVSSAGSPFPHVPDLPWCSIQSKHKLFVLFQVPLPTLWPPVTHGPSRDCHRAGKGRAIQSVRNVRSRLHKPAAKVFRWAVWTAWNGQWWWGAHWAWGPLRVYCWSSSEPKPWLIHQRGIVEWSTLWADVNTSCVSLVWFVTFLMFNVSNIWC